jgi:hypothetical protein
VKSIWEGRTIAAIKSYKDYHQCSLMEAKRAVEYPCLFNGLFELRNEGVIDNRLFEILEYMIHRIPR